MKKTHWVGRKLVKRKRSSCARVRVGDAFVYTSRHKDKRQVTIITAVDEDGTVSAKQFFEGRISDTVFVGGSLMYLGSWIASGHKLIGRVGRKLVKRKRSSCARVRVGDMREWDHSASQVLLCKRKNLFVVMKFHNGVLYPCVHAWCLVTHRIFYVGAQYVKDHSRLVSRGEKQQ